MLNSLFSVTFDLHTKASTKKVEMLCDREFHLLFAFPLPFFYLRSGNVVPKGLNACMFTLDPMGTFLIFSRSVLRESPRDF